MFPLLEIGSVSRCSDCGRDKGCRSPEIRIFGGGDSKVMFIGESPGVEEDSKGIPFVGPSGKFLKGCLDSLGWNLDIDCWRTNAVKCYSSSTPTDKQIVFCRPKLLKEIEELRPKVIILLGSVAIRSVIGFLWGDRDIGGGARWVGWKIPCGRWNCWICPTYHPAYLLRQNDPVLELFFRKHISEALNLVGSELPNLGDLRKRVECVQESSVVCSVLEGFIESGKPVSVDFETDRLKPEREGSCILTASVCSGGERTIAFPVVGDSGRALRKVLISDLPKIGWNIKHEDRWARRFLGVEVNNWVWDGMLASHVLDNRSGITSLKFQAFVHFGVEPWDSAVCSYMLVSGGNEKNRLGEVRLEDLLVYNGIDSLMTYLLVKKQMDSLGWSVLE